MKHIIATAILLAASGSAWSDSHEVPSGSYTVDPGHGYILFSYSHFGLSNPSVGFNSFDANLDFDADSPDASAITVTIDAASIDSRVPVFNEHLNGEDFFNTEKYPEIEFKATDIKKADGGRYTVSGDLTIKGVTKPVTLDASIVAMQHPMKKIPAIGVSASGMIKRSDWGLGAYAPAVSDEVKLTIEAEMLKD